MGPGSRAPAAILDDGVELFVVTKPKPVDLTPEPGDLIRSFGYVEQQLLRRSQRGQDVEVPAQVGVSDADSISPTFHRRASQIAHTLPPDVARIVSRLELLDVALLGGLEPDRERLGLHSCAYEPGDDSGSEVGPPAGPGVTVEAASLEVPLVVIQDGLDRSLQGELAREELLPAQGG